MLGARPGIFMAVGLWLSGEQGGTGGTWGRLLVKDGVDHLFEAYTWHMFNVFHRLLGGSYCNGTALEAVQPVHPALRNVRLIRRSPILGCTPGLIGSTP